MTIVLEKINKPIMNMLSTLANNAGRTLEDEIIYIINDFINSHINHPKTIGNIGNAIVYSLAEKKYSQIKPIFIQGQNFSKDIIADRK